MFVTRFCVCCLVLSAATGLPAQTVDPEVAAQAFNAEVLRDACENLVLAVRGLNPISQDDPGAMLCLGFIAGWSQAMDPLPQRAFCLPDTARERPGDLAHLIVTYIDGHPDFLQRAANDAMLEALTEAFPCVGGSEPDNPDTGNPVEP